MSSPRATRRHLVIPKLAEPSTELHAALPRIIEIARRRPRRLTEYHQVGKLIDDLPRGYRHNFFTVLANALADRGAEGLEASTLRKSLRFAQCVDRQTAAALAKLGVSWRQASRLTTRHLNQNQRVRLIAKVVKGKLELQDLPREITLRSGVDAYATARAVATARYRAARAIERLREIAEFKGTSEGVREKATAAIQELRRLAR